MFTGIIESVGRVVALRGSKLDVCVDEDSLHGDPLDLGESMAVNGCCLTLTEWSREWLRFDLSKETLKRTTFLSLEPGSGVNLERAMRADGRFGGHWVQGHVDGTAEVIGVETFEEFTNLRLLLKSGGEQYLIDKGSITLDGVSLTVVDPQDSEFSVALIPHTLSYTNLGERRIGCRVNVEFDVLAKYVERMMNKAGA